jgi:hypothetical protein
MAFDESSAVTVKLKDAPAVAVGLAGATEK